MVSTKETRKRDKNEQILLFYKRNYLEMLKIESEQRILKCRLRERGKNVEQPVSVPSTLNEAT